MPNTLPSPHIGPKEGARFRVHHMREHKQAGVPFTMLTAYDALSARIFDEAGIDMLLVGDSYGTTMLGYETTIPVTMSDMLHATRAVTRVVKRAFVVADLPFGAYGSSVSQAIDNAVELMKAGANGVKAEGGAAIAETVKAIVDIGIPVVGHLGFTPQSENALGGKRIQGRGTDATQRLVDDARALHDAGVCAITLEMVPSSATQAVMAAVDTPIIGIGAGKECDGQVLVWTDMAGMTDWVPSFVNRFGEVGQALAHAASDYRDAVRARTFPAEGHFHKT
ncbi:MAG: 3-methyl-2-oxobutanoate hydroxymethyltransferase [Actinomycetaceae bacterium]|nr:3-methyl-2-oxobutanoate hydroxymethyltransferase [Actinomycetaceae bacterium]